MPIMKYYCFDKKNATFARRMKIPYNKDLIWEKLLQVDGGMFFDKDDKIFHS
jgi:hypothetical protein